MAFLSLLSYHGFPVTAILLRLFSQGCLATTALSRLSSDGYLVLAGQLLLFWREISCYGCVFIAVFILSGFHANVVDLLS
jgi:hypothetical protein